jgi:hypothetical protein
MAKIYSVKKNVSTFPGYSRYANSKKVALVCADLLAYTGENMES